MAEQNAPIQHHATTLDEFLAPISDRLGHTSGSSKPIYDAKRAIQPHVTDELTGEALVERFCSEAAALGTELSHCTYANLAETVSNVVAANGAGLIVMPGEERYDETGITAALEADAANQVFRWDPANGREKNVGTAAQANIGITFVYGGIAETATVVQPCSPTCGRSVTLLPSVHIAIVDEKTIVSAMRDILARLEADRAAGKDIASQTVFISGPSNTADIELVRVEGVHGPTKVTYIIVKD